MRAILIFILIFFISYSFCSTDFKSRAIHKKNIQPHSKRVEGEWVIKFSKDTPQEIIQKVIERFENESVNIRNKRNIDSRGRIFGLTNIDENLCDSIVDEFFDYVEYYEPNVVVELDVKPNEYNEEYEKRSVQENVENWGLDRIDQRSLPLDNLYYYNYTGKNVIVYVIDSGIRTTHNEFGNRAKTVFNAFNDDGYDCTGHGTHVAGIVASKTYGVAKDANLHSLKVIGCDNKGTGLDVFEAFEYIIDNLQTPSVVQMSIGFTNQRVKAIEDIIAELRDKGVLTIVAAGNSFDDACKSSPAGGGDSLVVGSTTITDTMSSFSNYGSCVDIFAPGSNILSLGKDTDSSTFIMSGTSMATPFVSGVAALHLEEDPTLSPKALLKKIVDSGTKISGINNGKSGKLLYSNSITGLRSVFMMKNFLYIIIPVGLMMLF